MAESGDPNAAQKLLPRADPGGWAIGLIVLFAGGILAAIALDAQALVRLADPAYARGLITWLVILTTIGIAFILIYQAFNGATQSDDGFRRGREIFAGLLGMAGTIIGFYFGSAEKSDATLKVSEPIQEEMVIRAYVSGGTPPYRYTVEPLDRSVFKLTDKPATAETGWVKIDLLASPTGISAYTLQVSDAKNLKGSVKGEVRPLSKKDEKVNPTVRSEAPSAEAKQQATTSAVSPPISGAASDVDTKK
ncbi:MAG: hypothetical protein QM674_22830 [Burkholderiaceae bacterium]